MLFGPNIIVILNFVKKYKTKDSTPLDPFGIGHRILIQLLNKNTWSVDETLMLFDPNIIVILNFGKKYKTKDSTPLDPFGIDHQTLIQLLNKTYDELMKL